jgi:DNA-binding beta-propeller fold protein YncE
MTPQSCKLGVVAAALAGIVSIGSLVVANGPSREADNGTIWSAKHGAHTTRSFDTAPGAVANTVGIVTNTRSDVDTAGGDSDDNIKGSVWVVNRDRGELAVFDAKTGAVISTMPVGAGAHDICISEQVHKAYITAETINTVTTVDTRTLIWLSLVK